MYGVLATLVNIINSYEKQEINNEILEQGNLVKHYILEEHLFNKDPFFSEGLASTHLLPEK